MAKLIKEDVIIDGCTFRFGPHIIRLANVDAPGVGDAFANEAKKRLKKLIGNKDIDLAVMGMICNEVIAKVWVNDKSVNEEMNKFLKKLSNTR